MGSSERVPFAMFVILLKWRKRRVGGKDYCLCFCRKANIRLMTPNSDRRPTRRSAAPGMK